MLLAGGAGSSEWLVVGWGGGGGKPCDILMATIVIWFCEEEGGTADLWFSMMNGTEIIGLSFPSG